MTNVIHPFQLLVIALAGWLNRHQQAVIDYLIEENRVLKDQLDGQRLRLTDEQRMEVLQTYRADNEQLFARFMPDLPVDTYSTMDGTDRLTEAPAAAG